VRESVKLLKKDSWSKSDDKSVDESRVEVFGSEFINGDSQCVIKDLAIGDCFVY
jgi:hypothetical protein